jgi:hypothetical protein
MRPILAMALFLAVPRAALAGCEKDTDCKGERVCVDGACVGPAAPPRTQAARGTEPVSALQRTVDEKRDAVDRASSAARRVNDSANAAYALGVVLGVLSLAVIWFLSILGGALLALVAAAVFGFGVNMSAEAERTTRELVTAQREYLMAVEDLEAAKRRLRHDRVADVPGDT